MTEDEIAQMFANDDTPVELGAPVFDGQTVRATLTSVELVETTGKDEVSKGQSLVLKWTTDEELHSASTDGQPPRRYQPGYALTDRINIMPPADMQNREEVQRIAFQSLGRLARDLGTLSGESAKKGEIIRAIFKGKGKQELLKLSVDKTGQYQRIKYARANSTPF